MACLTHMLLEGFQCISRILGAFVMLLNTYLLLRSQRPSCLHLRTFDSLKYNQPHILVLVFHLRTWKRLISIPSSGHEQNYKLLKSRASSLLILIIYARKDSQLACCSPHLQVPNSGYLRLRHAQIRHREALMASYLYRVNDVTTWANMLID